MTGTRPTYTADTLPRFDRNFFDSNNVLSCIGSGSIGGKASGLAFINDFLARADIPRDFPGLQISIPRLVAIAGGVFDQFMERNALYDLLDEPNLSDLKIAVAFQRAHLPAEIVGDLRALIAVVSTPLAVRSSSVLEDALHEPFAGVYVTKMLPNNQPDADTRFRKLTEAIKFVYASTFFKNARDYRFAIGKDNTDEKMAVIVQQVVGQKHGGRYYPHVSGVARSYNFYAFGSARPDQGVVDLAFGLGKTIVDGGLVWTYCPEYPQKPPPVASTKVLFKTTQTKFWAINMGQPPQYDPTKETEYMVQSSIDDSEYDNTLRFVASTYQAANDRLVMGTGSPGPRLLNFAPLLKAYYFDLNRLLKKLIKLCEEALGAEVEIEFAANIGRDDRPTSFGFLQVRPMVVSHEAINLTDDDLETPENIVASERVLGNGIIENISDIVFVDPDAFTPDKTQVIAGEISRMNQTLAAKKRPYLLIGFGRWGSSDPWLGIPVEWSQISFARAIVEATLPNMNVELSQGSHFFHNLSSFQICYFLVHYNGRYKIMWDKVKALEEIARTEHVRHVRTENSLRVTVDGRSGRGVITL